MHRRTHFTLCGLSETEDSESEIWNDQPQPKLHPPSVNGRRGDPSIGTAADAGSRRTEIWMIETVKDIGPKLQGVALCHFERFEKR